jgi:hypothetical protein
MAELIQVDTLRDRMMFTLYKFTIIVLRQVSHLGLFVTEEVNIFKRGLIG